MLSMLLGVMIGAVAWVAALLIGEAITRAQLRQGQLLVTSAIATAASFAAGAALGPSYVVGASATPFAITTLLVTYRVVRERRQQQLLGELDRALTDGADVAPVIEHLRAWHGAGITFALRTLLHHGRVELVLELLEARWWRRSSEVLVALMTSYRVIALLELGRIAEAREAIDSCPTPANEAVAGELALHRLRVALAEGKAVEVPATVAPMHAPLRLEVLADALASRGDRIGSRAALAELRALPDGEQRLERLSRTNRPCAGLAADVLVDVGHPHR